MKQKKRMILAALICSLGIGLLHTIWVSADEASVTFGSAWYDRTNREIFPVGVYINSENGVGEYLVTLHYNPLRLDYIRGADEADEENGILILKGEEGGSQIKYWLEFQPISGGETALSVEKAEIHLQNSTEELCDITAYGMAPVYVSGEDAADAEEERREGADSPEQESTEAETRLVLETTQALQAETEMVPQIIIAADTVMEPETTGMNQQEKKTSIIFNVYIASGIAVVILLALVEVLFLFIGRLLQRRQRQMNDNSSEKKGKTVVEHKEDSDIGFVRGDEEKEMLPAEQEAWKKKEFGTPVIRIEDVTMEFHLSSSNPSGLKDYLIQMMKREIVYRKLFALYHVSFNVYRGEVVGIIGTNGSGKSTLLKIVSGVLKPTSGKVKVDKRKVQLLTLGTGFDTELTARENVYLNGSIIGYTREFLDAHYKEIVEFAELQDFMEEKVKNFSSGMVSRLGFAIATVGNAAEILILDEVLSVGDEFFRKKSLKRVKEMIHGGSTVLMVSHSMETILENCTKCVWIEKGKLQMIGDSKSVCNMYRQLYINS